MNPKRRAPPPIIDAIGYIGTDPERGTNKGGSVEVIKLRAKYQADYELSTEFLSSYSGSAATFNSYRRDIERLLQWCWNIREISLLSLSRTDFDQFMKFNKKPPAAWIGEKNVPRFTDMNGLRIANRAWRPFVIVKKKRNSAQYDTMQTRYTPSDASIVACYSSLSTFYEYLVEERKIASNPIKQVRQKSKYLTIASKTREVRRLTNFQWDYVLESAAIMADESPAEHERTLFIMSALYSLYLRISELASDELSQPVMSDFYKDEDNNWWFKAVGKGKVR